MTERKVGRDVPENLRIRTKAELREFMKKRLAEDEKSNKWYTVEQLREELAQGRLGVD